MQWGDDSFLSVDPLVANYADPQSFNAYSYARNNPANLTDPTGMCAAVGLVGPCGPETLTVRVGQVNTSSYAVGVANPNGFFADQEISGLGGFGSSQGAEILTVSGTPSDDGRGYPTELIYSYLEADGREVRGITPIGTINPGLRVLFQSGFPVYTGDPDLPVEPALAPWEIIGIARGLYSGLRFGLSAAAKAASKAATQAERQALRVTDKQLGRKFGQHRNPDRPGYRTHGEYRQRAEQILNDPNARITRFPENSPKFPGETHYEAGGDLLRLDPAGNFRSLYPAN